MKKLLISLMAILFLSSLFALESDPSDVVGYVKRTATIGYSYFSLPFTFYAIGVETMTLDDIIGDQLTGGNILTGDRIIEIPLGTYAYYNGTNWTGALTSFTDNYAYQFKVHSTHTDQDVYLAGNVEQEVQLMPNTCVVGYSYHGIREAGEVDVSALDLLDSGFTGGNILTSDRLIDVSAGDYAYYNTGTSLWAGSLTTTDPAEAYQVKVYSTHSSFPWTYDPTDNPLRNVNTTKVKKNVIRIK